MPSAPRTERFRAVRYAAFRVLGDLQRTPTRLIELGEPPASLYAAAKAALLRANHKDHIVIKVADEIGGEVKLHVFAVKKEAHADYVIENHVPRRVHRLYAAPVCVIDGGVLAL